MEYDLHDGRWRKASASSTQGTECVELHSAGAVRDSKHPASVLRIDWAGLVAAVKDDTLT